MEKDMVKKIERIFNNLSEEDRYYLGNEPIGPYTVYANVIEHSYLVLDDYRGEHADEHPFDGLIVSVAASPVDRGKGITDQLIQEALKHRGKKFMIGEVAEGNEHSAKMLMRNGFHRIATLDDIEFYIHR